MMYGINGTETANNKTDTTALIVNSSDSQIYESELMKMASTIPAEQFNHFFEQVSNALMNREVRDTEIMDLTLKDLLNRNDVEISIPDALIEKMQPILSKPLGDEQTLDAFSCPACTICAICALCGEANGASAALGVAGVFAV